jgi:hypothetical protein
MTVESKIYNTDGVFYICGYNTCVYKTDNYNIKVSVECKKDLGGCKICTFYWNLLNINSK